MAKLLLKGLEVGPFLSNCYLVGAEESKEGMVVDPGADADLVLREIESLGLKIKLIAITHGHIDHIMAIAQVKEATGAELAIHRDDLPLLQERHSPMATAFGLRYPSPPQPERVLLGGEKLEVGGLSFLVLHTPGHSPGGICLYGEGVVFTGDTLFQGSIGRFDMPGADGRVLLNSIHTKLMVLPDDTIVLPGHGPQTTIATERRWNPFLRGTFRLV